MNAPRDSDVQLALEQGFCLDELRIDPLTGEVNGPGGSEKLDPKVMGVLVAMAERHGQVVTREELLGRLWPNAVVTDDALSRCFYELRRQLSRAGGDGRYRDMLETLPKRGYRLNGQVSAVPQPGKRRYRALGAAGAALALIAAAVSLWIWRSPDAESPARSTTGRSIAVLPFEDMSATGDQGYFSDGISEEILNRLVESSDLRVISRTSSFSFRDQNADIPEIAAKLDVTHVLEGSVRRAGDRVRITAQLISAATNAHVWSDTYDRNLGDIFDVQDDIAAEVAAALDATLTGKGAPGGPVNAEAYERYLQGRFFYNRRAPGDVELMAKYLEESVEIDPGYAPAWAELAGAYYLLADEHPDAKAGWHEKQGRAAQRAIELDPELAVAHIRLSQHYWRAGDRARGEEHYQRAVALDPDNLLLLSMRAGHALWEGSADEAVELQRRVVARDPLSAVQRNNLGSYLLAAGRYEEALAEMRTRIELNPVTTPGDDAEMMRVLVLLGRFDEASAVVAAMPDGEYRDFGLALLYAAPGRRTDADAALRRLAATPQAIGDLLLPDAYAQRGMNEQALEAFQRIRSAIERDKVSDEGQIYNLRQSLHKSPFLQDLQSDPRWRALTEEKPFGAS